MLLFLEDVDLTGGACASCLGRPRSFAGAAERVLGWESGSGQRGSAGPGAAIGERRPRAGPAE